MTITLKNYLGTQIQPFIDDLAQLRIQIFREWPYLYEGTMDYEARYLANYAAHATNFCAIAWDAHHIIGASTAMWLKHADALLIAAVANSQFTVDSIMYFGESVLLPDYRQHGIGHQFFDHREAYARERGAQYCGFYAVDRPKAHPLRPAGYWDIHRFWQGRGYTHCPSIETMFPWLDIGEKQETFKPMSFWIKSLQDEN